MFQELDDHLCTSLCSNQVEAEVIVHSELSDPGREEEEGGSTRGPSLSEDIYSPLSQPSPSGEEEPIGKLPLPECPSNIPSKTTVAKHNRETGGTRHQPTAGAELQQDTGLTNGFHSPKTARSVLRSEQLENGDSRHCPSAAGKAISAGPFVSSGFVHSTSAAQTYLCP